MLEINLPYSKSIVNRLLVLEFLSKDDWHLQKFIDSDDSILMKRNLDKMRSILKKNQNSDFTELYCGNAGTVYRFLLAVCAVTEGKWRLTCSERMKERPNSWLIETLQELGADIVKLPNADLLITGTKLQSKTIVVDEIESSQFVSALMLISPFIEGELNYCFKEKISSFSYITLTKNIIDKVLNNKIDAKTCVERDWTSASYFFAALAILQTKKKILFRELTLNSLQSDVILAQLMTNFGIKNQESKDGVIAYFDENQEKNLEEFEFNFGENIDLSPTFMVLCRILGLESKFSGLEALRYKESDRLSALSLNSLQSKTPLATFEDHRLAMAFALFRLKFPQIEIENPQVVSKSFPNFWHEFGKLEKP